ncbi:MAG TPA: LytTR family DNA-binding domain-containing protein [Sediminibacterium sp.]|nr:LytTR family DNA-binding domain-containing protein [Sediminibacterium sp.]
MHVLIIEDEAPAAKRLIKLLEEIIPEMQLVDRLDSVERSISFLEKNPALDLIFMDIQLADGLSFDILSAIKIQTPIIFTTAFDQFTLKAFKVNSIDYLLKPIDQKELAEAIQKYKTLHTSAKPSADFSDKMLQLMADLHKTKFRERLLIKRGQQLNSLKTELIAYCYADGKLCYAVDRQHQKHLLEQNLSQLETQLDPAQFFRINRNLLVHIDAIQKVYTWLGGRLKLEFSSPPPTETIVSRERVNEFKDWLGDC